MEIAYIAYIAIPVAAVFVPKIHCFNCDTTYISYCSKNHSVTHLWGRLCLLQQNFITLKAVKAY